MKCNMWKVILVFSVMLMFAFSGELAAQVPDNLVITPDGATLNLNGAQDFQARLTSSGTGVNGETIYFYVLDSPALGSVDPEDSMTVNGGYAHTTYTASTVAGTDTLVAYWEDLADTVIITINPGAATSLDVTPGDTTVVVTEDATIVVELLDDYLNHVDATSSTQVTFATSGLGSFGTASVNGDNGCIEVAYTTDDSVAMDVITTELVVNHTRDYDTVRTIGAAPASMELWSYDDSIVVVSDGDPDWYWETINVQLYDEYGNVSGIADPYEEIDPWDAFYRVYFTVSEGGGGFFVDSVFVSDEGYADNGYHSSPVAGVYTITATSGDATADMPITHIPDYPDSLVLTPDSVAIAAGTDTTLTATMFDQYGNHVNATSTGNVIWYENGDGDFYGAAYIDEESHNIKRRYLSYLFAADTAQISVFLNIVLNRSQYYDTVTVFSAEPGDFDHYAISIDCGRDTSNVSDGVYDEANLVMIEAQDVNNIRLYTYTNPDTVTLTLNESDADSAQVAWFILGLSVAGFEPEVSDYEPPSPYAVGLNAYIPEEWFYMGAAYVGIANQIAETVTMSATDTAGHTGTSPELTWLPIDVVGFDVAIEGGLTTIHAIYDTVNMEVTAIDEFGNTTDVGLPLNVILSATRPVNFLSGETQLMEDAVSLFPMVATAPASDLVLRIADISHPAINGSSDPITVNPSGIAEGPVVSGISASFGSGDISYAVAEAGEFRIKVYNKVGMEVGSLVDGAVSRGYYQASLKGLGLSSDIYFVVMQGPGVNKKIKATLIK